MNPRRHFDTVFYSGTGSTNKIESLEFAPDLVWVKRRDSSSYHIWSDTVRGAGNYLVSNTADAESSGGSQLINGFLKDGFQVGTENAVNNSSGTYVAWCWKDGGTAVSNTDGDITSSVSANTEAGFSIVTYSGNGSGTGQTVGHGLGKAPKVIFLKKRNAATNWFVYHGDSGNGAMEGLNTNSTYGSGLAPFNTTAPSSTVVTLGNTDGNQSGINFVLYCWAEIPGYSKLGSYKANGSSDGPYVHCGFKPAWILIKNTSLGQPWVIMDNKINPTNLADTRLSPSSADGDHTSGDNYVDFLSNGFKVRSGSSTDINYSTSYPNHIFMAFAEQPGFTNFDTHANAR